MWSQTGQVRTHVGSNRTERGIFGGGRRCSAARARRNADFRRTGGEAGGSNGLSGTVLSGLDGHDLGVVRFWEA